MRRLWANILIACAGIVTVFAATPSTINKIDTNGDFKTQRQFTFQLSQKEDIDGGYGKEIEANSAEEMAKVMEDRLIASKISAYSISTSGNDLVTVTFAADSDDVYSQITTYLTFSGSFALVNSQNDLVKGEDFLNGNAYKLDVTVNEYPTVIIPIKTDSSDFQNLVTKARENPDATESTEEGEEAEETANIYLLYNYVEGDLYDILKERGTLEEKIFLTFNAISDEKLYYNGSNSDGKANFSQVCGFSDSNGNGYADPVEVSAAFSQADFLVNLLNAKSLDYDVKLIRGGGTTDEDKIWVAPNVESIKSYSKIQFNATLISTVVAIVVIALLLVVFFRLGAMNIMATTIVSTFLTLLFVTLIGIEYNTLSTIAYVTVAVVSLISGIIYCNKLKDEAYRGRTLKKANAEASKKSLLPIVDVHVVAIIIGVMIFLLGGTALHGLASIITLGSLVSLIFNTLGLKGLMWLATNATGLTGKYQVFGINPENVPNHMADEKQRYFGEYADKDFTKKKKSVSIASTVAFVVALAGIVVSASLNSGNLFKQASNKITGSELLVTTKYQQVKDDDKTSLTNEKINNMLKDILVFEEGESLGTILPDDPHRLSAYVSGNIIDVESFVVSTVKYEDEQQNTYVTTYFNIPLKQYLDGEKYQAMFESMPMYTGSLNDILEYAFEYNPDVVSSKEDASISLNSVMKVSNQASPDWQKMSLSVFIAILILTIYFILRYRLSRGLAMLVYPFVSAGVAIGLFALLSLCGLALPTNIVATMPLIILATYIFMILIANKERDILLEDKVKDNTIEHRNETSKRAVGMVMSAILAFVAIIVYLIINFFGFAPSVNSFAYLAALIGVLVALGSVVYTYVPLSCLLFKWFSGVNVNRKPRKRKQNTQVVKKSAEPEEAIFIGIND